MGRLSSWRIITTAFTVAAIVYAVRTRQSHGRLLAVPFEFRVPTLDRLRQRLWNPDDPRVLTPNVFGAGWVVNVPRLMEIVRDALNEELDDEEAQAAPEQQAAQ